MTDDSVSVLYINNKAALSSRMFTMKNHIWGIFSIDSNVVFKDLKLSK